MRYGAPPAAYADNVHYVKLCWWVRIAPGYSSPENRSHADWRVIWRAAPMRAQVTLRSRKMVTSCWRLASVCAPTAAMRGSRSRICSSVIVSSQAGSCVPGSGGFCCSSRRMSLHSPTHSLQMYTPGPAITFATSEPGLAQNEQRTWVAVAAAGVSLVMVPPGQSCCQADPDICQGSPYAAGSGDATACTARFQEAGE